jgi:phage shock protein C
METTATTQRRLYKSRRNRMIDGICGGIAEYFGFDPTIVRILWVLVTLLGGSGFFLYIAAMIIMPVNPNDVGVQSATSPVYKTEGDKRRFWGIILVLIGAFVLMLNLGWIADFNWWSMSRTVVFPVLLVILGAVLIYTHTQRQQQPATASNTEQSTETAGQPSPPLTMKELRRSIKDKKLFGVCGGIGAYFNIDSTIVRIVFIFLILASFGWGLLLYIILGIVMPEDKPIPTSA